MSHVPATRAIVESGRGGGRNDGQRMVWWLADGQFETKIMARAFSHNEAKTGWGKIRFKIR